LGRLVKKDICIFYGHLVYFTAFGYILLSLGTFYGNLVYFYPFWYVAPRKIWQPCSAAVHFGGIDADERTGKNIPA
jgi:hypothetical protein